MNNQRLGILIMAGIGMVATFLPWSEGPVLGSVRGTKTGGWFTFFLFLIPFIFSLLGDRSKPLRNWFLYAAVIPGILATAIGFWKIFDVNTRMRDEGRNSSVDLDSFISPEYGLYLVVLAGTVLIIAAFMFGDNGNGFKNKKSTFSYRSKANKKGPPD